MHTPLLRFCRVRFPAARFAVALAAILVLFVPPANTYAGQNQSKHHRHIQQEEAIHQVREQLIALKIIRIELGRSGRKASEPTYVMAVMDAEKVPQSSIAFPACSEKEIQGQLHEVLAVLPQAEVLHLASCVGLERDFVESLPTHLSKLDLREILVNEKTPLDADWIRRLGKHCPNLTNLEMPQSYLDPARGAKRAEGGAAAPGQTEALPR